MLNLQKLINELFFNVIECYYSHGKYTTLMATYIVLRVKRLWNDSEKKSRVHVYVCIFVSIYLFLHTHRHMREEAGGNDKTSEVECYN